MKTSVTMEDTTKAYGWLQTRLKIKELSSNPDIFTHTCKDQDTEKVKGQRLSFACDLFTARENVNSELSSYTTVAS